MVLEGLINPLKAESKPSHLIFYGFVYGLLSIILGLWIFSSEASMVIVFLAVMACLPLVYGILTTEEQIGLSGDKEKNLLKHHAIALSVFMFLFIGLTLAFTISYVFLPEEYIDTAFHAQKTAMDQNKVYITGNSVFNDNSVFFFKKIVLNNLRVLVLALLFSFIYGSGAMFILTWNAAVLGVAIGATIRIAFANLSSLIGFELVKGYAGATFYGLSRYVLHGVPEILAYFVAGLAGGIVSVAMVRHDFFSKKFNRVLTDSYVLFILAAALILIAAILETWVTPIFF